MSKEEIRARFVELAPDEWEAAIHQHSQPLWSGFVTFSLPVCEGSTNKTGYVVGVQTGDPSNDSSALALLKWLNEGQAKKGFPPYQLWPYRGKWWIEEMDEDRDGPGHEEPVYAVMLCLIGLWENDSESTQSTQEKADD